MHFIRQTYQRLMLPLEIESQLKEGEPPYRTPRSNYTTELQRETDEIVSRHTGTEEYFFGRCLNCCGRMLACLKMFLPCCCCCLPSPIHEQPTATFGVLQNLGRFTRILPPGINIVNPVTERVLVCSRQTQILEVVQPVITKDNVTCRLLSIVYYRVVDPLRAIYSLEHGDVAKAVREMAFAAVRTVAGENLFETLVAQRSKIAHELLEYSNKQVAVWGVYIESIFLKDMLLDTQTQDYLSMATQQRRVSAATLIAAQGLVESAKFYEKASEELATPAAIQIRYLNMISDLSQTQNQKLIMLKMIDE